LETLPRYYVAEMPRMVITGVWVAATLSL